jgi:16S rRNA (uracil1498-N3)-methyltransferase
MPDRYFVDSPITGHDAVLEGPEMHHLVHVMRAGPGDEVVVFDGSGAEFVAQITTISKNQVVLAVLSRHEIDRELSIDISLAVALPKGDRQKWLVEKAVELGVRRLIPLRTARAVAQPVEQAIARLRRTAIEASKQCGRNRLMAIDAPRTWDELLLKTRDVPSRLLADPSGISLSLSVAAAGPGSMIAAVGPEGGFTEAEVADGVAAGWGVASLGRPILRVETAAILMVAMLTVRAR